MSVKHCLKSIRPLAVIFFMLNSFLVQPARSAAADLPADAQVMRRQKLFDPGIGKDAYSVLVPPMWKMHGEVSWAPGLPTPYFDLSVSDADQRAAWRQFPRLMYADGVRENWIAAFPRQKIDERRFAEGMITPNGLEIRKLPTSPREYVEKTLGPKLCPEFADAKDVTLVFEKDLPDMAKAVTAADPQHRPSRSCRFRVAYTAPDGPVEREFVATLIVQRYTPHPGVPGPSAMWIGEVATCRAPKGKLDALMPTFTTIGSSVAPQPDWFNIMVQTAEMFVRQVQEADDQLIGDQREAINARMEILRDAARKASADTSDRIRQRFADQQNAKAQVQRQFMHYVTDTSSFRDPNNGSTVTLKANYRYQYVNNFGDVIQTDDATFTPPVDPKTTWRQMEKAD